MKTKAIAVIKPNNPVKIFTSEFIGSGGKQTYDFHMLGEINGTKFRVNIHRDDYLFQSRVHAELWSPTDLRWNEGHRLQGESDVVKSMTSPHSRDTTAQHKSCEFVAQVLIEHLLYLLGVKHA